MESYQVVPWPGGGGVLTLTWYKWPKRQAHICMIHICACLLGHFFTKFGIAIGGFHQRRRSPNYINWVYFGQIIVKSTQFDPNWVLFFRKWYTDRWEIWQKIGIKIVRFSRSSRHIHVRFWWKNPPPRCPDQPNPLSLCRLVKIWLRPVVLILAQPLIKSWLMPKFILPTNYIGKS